MPSIWPSLPPSRKSSPLLPHEIVLAPFAVQEVAFVAAQQVVIVFTAKQKIDAVSPR